MSVCKFTGESLNGECPKTMGNEIVGSSQPLAIQFENNSFYNTIRANNLSAAYGNTSDSIRLLDGPTRVNGDLLVEGDIICQGQFKCYGDDDNNEDGFDFSIFANMQTKLDKMEQIMEYLSKRFSINLNDIKEETKGLKDRSNASKRLDAID